MTGVRTPSILAVSVMHCLWIMASENSNCIRWKVDTRLLGPRFQIANNYLAVHYSSTKSRKMSTQFDESFLRPRVVEPIQQREKTGRDRVYHMTWSVVQAIGLAVDT